MTAHSINSTSDIVEQVPGPSPVQQWLSQGEALYDNAMENYRALEHQLADLEAKLTEKRAEVNQIAQLIGKPPVDGLRRVSAQIIEERDRNVAPGTTTHIARALAGKFNR